MSDKSSNEKAPVDRTLDLDKELATVLKTLPEEKQKVIIQALTITQQHHSGPLPDAETIRTYNEVIPNGGDRLMSTVENQLNHRITIEKDGVKRTFNQSSTGQWMAFIIAVVFGVIAWDLSKTGHELSAQILGSFDLVALVAVFVTGKLTSNK